MEFSYSLTGTGWSEAHISAGEESTTLTASYLGDALGDLLRACLALLDGATGAECTWEEEPGEFRWVFVRSGDEVDLKIFDYVMTRGKCLFDSTTSLRDMAKVLAATAQQVLDEYGESGYLEKWVEHPFPTEILASIQAHLT